MGRPDTRKDAGEGREVVFNLCGCNVGHFKHGGEHIGKIFYWWSVKFPQNETNVKWKTGYQ